MKGPVICLFTCCTLLLAAKEIATPKGRCRHVARHSAEKGKHHFTFCPSAPVIDLQVPIVTERSDGSSVLPSSSSPQSEERLLYKAPITNFYSSCAHPLPTIDLHLEATTTNPSFLSIDIAKKKRALPQHTFDYCASLLMTGTLLPQKEAPVQGIQLKPLYEFSSLSAQPLNDLPFKFAESLPMDLGLEREQIALFSYSVPPEPHQASRHLLHAIALLEPLYQKFCTPSELGADRFEEEFRFSQVASSEQKPLFKPALGTPSLPESPSVAMSFSMEEDSVSVDLHEMAKDELAHLFIAHIAENFLDKALVSLLMPVQPIKQEEALAQLPPEPLLQDESPAFMASEIPPFPLICPSLTSIGWDLLCDQNPFCGAISIEPPSLYESLSLEAHSALVKKSHSPADFKQSQLTFDPLSLRVDLSPAEAHIAPCDEISLGYIESIDISQFANSLSEKLVSGHLFLAQREDHFNSLDVSLRSYNSLDRHDRLNKKYRHLTAYHQEFPSMTALNTHSFLNPFDPYIEISEAPSGQGYLFSIELKPTKEIDLPAKPSHFIFLIDRSQAVEKHRLDVFKNGVMRALEYLKDEDTFNIGLFDTRIKFFADSASQHTPESRNKLKQFFREEKHAPLHSTLNIYELLNTIAHQFRDQEGIINVVLLTDGSTLADIKSKRAEIKSWLEEAPTHLSLSIATCCNQTNSSLMTTLCELSGGEFIFSPTNAAFGRKFAGLIHRISHPLAHHVSLTPMSGEVHLTSEEFSKLYRQNCLKIYGQIENLEPFELMIQGIGQDEWINIRQKIDFKRALKVGKSLSREIAKKEALPYYLAFIEEGDADYLEKARLMTASEK